MAKKTFITKEDLKFYHDETAKKLKTSLKKVLDNIGDIDIAEKFSELELSIKYSAVLGLIYDENTNTTTFIKGTSAGNVKLNELYIKRDGLYKPLSEIIGDMSFGTDEETGFSGTKFESNVKVGYNFTAGEVLSNLYYANIYNEKEQIFERHDIYNELLHKVDFFKFENDDEKTIYIILDLNNDILNGIFYTNANPGTISDFNKFLYFLLIPGRHRTGRAASADLELATIINVKVYKNTAKTTESLESEYNTQQLLYNEHCLFYYTASYFMIPSGSLKKTAYNFNGTIYGDYIFSIYYDYLEERDSVTVKTGPYISLVKNKTPIGEIKSNETGAVTSGAVYDALENLSNDIADTYVSKTAHEESEQTIVNIKKLLYNLTTRVDALDLGNIAFSDAKSLTTLRRVNYFGNLSYDDRTIISERYGLQNKNYIIIFEDNTSNSFVKNFKIGLRLGFKNESFENYIAATILDIYYFKSKNSSQKYYYCVCVSSDVAKYFMATSSYLTLYLLPENLPTAPTISITDVTQTSATLSWKDSDGSTGSHIVVKYGSQVIKDISTTSYVSTIQTRTINELSCETTYTVEITAKLNSWESSKNTKTFTTNPIVKPEPVYIYMPNASTNCLTRIRQEKDHEFFTENETELFANGVIYTDNKFNSKEMLAGLYLGCGLDESLNSEEYAESLPNRIITSDNKFTLLIQPAYNGESVETFNYKIRLNIYADLGIERECFTGYLSNKLNPIDPTKFEGEILYDNSVITPRTVKVLGIVYDSHDFIESDNVHMQILKVRWKYPNDFNEYVKTLGIYREDDETPAVYENYNLFQNKPIDDIFYTVIIKGFKNTLFRFEINKPDEIYYDSTFVYRFNVCSINRLIGESPITMNKNTYESDPNNVLTAYNSKNVQNILVQYSDFNTKTFYKILPATPIFYNIPDTYGRKQYIIECANIEECAIKGKYFDLFNQGSPMYLGDSGQYLTIYFTYGLNDLYAYFGSYLWIESEDEYISAVDTFNLTLYDMGIDSLILNDGGDSYDPNIELLYPKITIKLNPSSTGSDDEIKFFTYNDYSDYYKKEYLQTDSGIWEQLANNDALDAIRITNDESMKIDDPNRRVVRPGIFSLTFDIACIELLGVSSIDRIDILVDFNMNDRTTPFVGEVIQPQRIMLTGIQSLIKGLK